MLLRLAFAAAFVCFAVLPPAHAARGIDRRFGDQGSVLFRTMLYPYEVVPLPDGRFLVAGTATTAEAHDAPALGRLRADGSWDPTFGNGGIYVLPSDSGLAPHGGRYYHLQRLSDGRIVAVGNTWTRWYDTRNCTLVGRFSADGAPDAAFGGSGQICYQFPGADPDVLYASMHFPTGLIVDAADRVYVTGPAGGTVPGIVRLWPDAQPDASYGNAGVAELPTGATPTHLALDANGRLLLASVSYVPNTVYGRLQLRRILDNGTIDSTFGTGGLAQYARDGQGFYPVSLVLDAMQRPVLGFSGGDPFWEYAYRAARYTSDGALDVTFNANAQPPDDAGTLRLDVPSASDTNQLAALPLPDGRLLMLGNEATDTSFHPVPMMARLDADQAYDASFGTSAQPGIERPVPFAPAASTAVIRAVARDAEGGVIVVGSFAGDAAFGDCGFLMRLLPDALFGDGFELPGATQCQP